MQDDHSAMTQAHRMSALRKAAIGLGVDSSVARTVTDEPTLFGIIIDTLLFPQRAQLTFADAADRAHLGLAAAKRLWLALGNPDPEDVAVVDDGEAEMLSFLGMTQSIIGHDAAAMLAWRIGSSMSRIAETVVADFEFEMGYPRDPQGTPRVELAHFFADVIDNLLPRLSRSMDVVLRQRLAGKVPLDWPGDDLGLPAISSAVGALRFGGVPAEDLVGLLDALPEQVQKIVATDGGRFVKFTDGGALFTAPDSGCACRAAAQILMLPHLANTPCAIGLEWGRVSVRRGQVFGPVVSTARRLARLARRGEILVGAHLYASTSAELRFEATDEQVFRGVDGSVTVYRLLSR